MIIIRRTFIIISACNIFFLLINLEMKLNGTYLQSVVHKPNIFFFYLARLALNKALKFKE